MAGAAYEEAARVLGPNDRTTRHLRLVYTIALSDRRETAGRAEKLFREWIGELRREETPEAKRLLPMVQMDLAIAMSRQGKSGQAASMYREILAASTQPSSAADDETINFVERNLGFYLTALNRLDEAAVELRHALDAARRGLGNRHGVTIDTIGDNYRILARLGRYKEALPLALEALDHYRQTPDTSGGPLAQTAMDAARFASMLGEDRQAASLFVEAVAAKRRADGDKGAARFWKIGVLHNGLHLLDPQRWKSQALRGNARRIVDDALFESPSTSFDPGDADLSQAKFTLRRWKGPGPGDYETAAEGDAAALLALAEPPPGLYRLSLAFPRKEEKQNVRTQTVARPVLVAPWTVQLYQIGNGLQAAPGKWSKRLAEKPDQTLSESSLAKDADAGHGFGPDGKTDHFAVLARCSLDLPAGAYRFMVKVNDGARLWVDGRKVVDHWPIGKHAEAWPTVTGQTTLAQGRHEIRVEYFQATGGAQLWVAAEPIDGAAKTTR